MVIEENMYDLDTQIGNGQDFNSVPECVRKEYTSRNDYFYELSEITTNDKDTFCWVENFA